MGGGDMALEFTSCYFCFYISPTSVFFPHLHFFKSLPPPQKKVWWWRIKTKGSSLPFKTSQGQTDLQLG